MSLETAAKHLASKGRGPDTQLVHLSLGELNSLQELAKAHGGSLSINPDTGLPEAGFLSNILPMVLGAGLTAATGGALSPLMLGLGVGGVQAMRTGDLGQGLMAGLGAYGGAGLTAGLAGPGLTVSSPQAAQIATAQTAAPAAQAGALYPNLPPPDVYANPFAGTSAQYAGAEAVGRQDLTNYMANKGIALGPTGEIVSAAPSVTSMPAPPAVDAVSRLSPGDMALRTAPYEVAPSNSVDFLSGMSDVSAVEGPGVAGAGLPTRSTTFASRLAAMPKKELVRYGLAAAAPSLLAQPKYKKPELDSEQYRYAYTPGRVADPRAGYPEDYRGEYSYFEPRFTRMAEGGSTDEYKYTYDPATGTYKKIEPPAEETQPQMPQTQLPGSDGGSMAQAGQPGRSGGMNPATTIGIGQALQGYGQSGFAPGALAAGLIGDAVVNSGINAFANMQNQEAMNTLAGIFGDEALGVHGMAEGRAEAEAAANTAANEAGVSAAFGNADSTYAGGETTSDLNVGGITALARGGHSHLGDYSDGGRLLRGPGDGVSDSIPATIGNKRPARLADGEFVIPARIVSELGNGSTEAGARKLYAMMGRVQRARGKTTGKGKVAKNTRSEKYLPA